MSAGVNLCCACVLEKGEEQSLGKGRAGRRWCPDGWVLYNKPDFGRVYWFFCLFGEVGICRAGKIISGFSSFHFNASVSRTEEICASACCDLQTLWVHVASSFNLWKQVTCQDLRQYGNPALIKLGMGGTRCLATQAEEERNP